MQELLTTVHAAPACSCVCQAPHERFEGYWTFKQCISRARGAEFIICKCALWQHSFASACGLLWHASAICSNRLARTICDRLSDNALGCEAAQSVPTRCCTPCSAQHSSLPWRLQSALSLAESGTLLPSSKSSEHNVGARTPSFFGKMYAAGPGPAASPAIALLADLGNCASAHAARPQDAMIFCRCCSLWIRAVIAGWRCSWSHFT